jgi:predicted dehydrogenase
MARHHIRRMLTLNTEIVVVCEPSEKEYQLSLDVFKELNIAPPPNQPDLAKLLADYSGKLDTAFIITPHAYHHDQTKLCLEAGLDVLLEKPMVLNVAEAHSLIATRDRTGKLLVVAFQGGLSPQIRMASELIASGQLGELLTISGTVWQNWADLSRNTWRTVPEIAGGGFLFDTGAHMLNSICDLAGQDFVEVAAWLDNRDSAVDLMGTVMGRLENGGLVTINACGATAKSCTSEIMVFCTQGIIRTGQWGERLLIQRHNETELTHVDLPPMRGAWEQFLAVRSGEIDNPSPPEVGLRMVRLWNAIQASAAQNGTPVQCSIQPVSTGVA